jgi:hypothetical protein
MILTHNQIDIFILLIITIVLSFALIREFYFHYHNRHISKGEVLASFIPDKKIWIVNKAIISTILGLLACLLIIISTLFLLKENKANFFVLLILFISSLLFVSASVRIFPFKGLKLIFTEKGIICGSSFFKWQDIDYLKWKTHKKHFYLTMWKRGDSVYWLPGGERSLRYYSFDINTKQLIDDILKSKRVKIIQLSETNNIA